MLIGKTANCLLRVTSPLGQVSARGRRYNGDEDGVIRLDFLTQCFITATNRVSVTATETTM